MRKVMKYPIYPITFAYVNGIFFANYFAWNISWHFFALAISLFAILIWLGLYKSYTLYSIQSSISPFIIFILGFLFGMINYSQNVTKQVIKSGVHNGYLIIKEQLKSNEYSQRYFADFYTNDTKERVLIYFVNDTVSLPIGAHLYGNFETQSIRKATAPLQFDYATYLANRNVYQQIYLSNQYVFLGIHKDFNYYLTKIRTSLLNQYYLFYDKSEDQSMIAGLIFGQRQALPQEIEEAYRNTGVMHVLAVSGLHVVLLYKVLHTVLKFITRNRWVHFVIVGLFLIAFAMLSGLSGSVVRAVLMSLIFLIGGLVKRDNLTIHSMVLSMLLILWFAPSYLFDIGFQLSYLAVFSIIYIYPLMSAYINKQGFILKQIGEIIGVSVVAQLGVAFLSIYYFHQFPLSFVISNLIAVPLTSLALVLLLIQMPLLYVLPWLSSLITVIVSFLINVCNQLLVKLNRWEHILINDIYITSQELFVYTISLFLLVAFIRFRKALYLHLMFVVLIGLQLFQLYNLLGTDESLYVNANRNEIEILYRKDSYAQIYKQGEGVVNINKFAHFYQLTDVKTYSFKNVLYHQQLFYVLDSLEIIDFPEEIDYLIIKDNPIVNKDRVLSKLQFKNVILHPNMYATHRERWIRYLEQKNIPYHDMRNKGYVKIAIR